MSLTMPTILATPEFTVRGGMVPDWFSGVSRIRSREYALSGGCERKEDHKLRTLIRLAIDTDRSAMFLNNLPGDRKPEAGAFRFGCEKRLEKTSLILHRDARPGI